jgi:carbonic anhydrase
MELTRMFRLFLVMAFIVSFSARTPAQTHLSVKHAKSKAACADQPFAYDNGPVGQGTWCDVCNRFRRFQAPINIPGKIADGSPDPALPAIKFIGYDKPTPLATKKNLHNLKVDYSKGDSSIEIAGMGTYKLQEFHFHRPSEEAVNNYRYPMVIHLVHQKANCPMGQPNCAVALGVLVEEGEPTQETSNLLKILFQHFPPPLVQGGPSIQVKDLLPSDYENAGYYNFPGSLTTPPCTENVTFFILKTPVKFSAEQIRQFARRYPLPNARDIQDFNNRPIRDR